MCFLARSVITVMSDSGSSQRPGTAGASSDAAGGQDITAVVQEMLTAMQSKFQTMSNQIIGRSQSNSQPSSLFTAQPLGTDSTVQPLHRFLNQLAVLGC